MSIYIWGHKPNATALLFNQNYKPVNELFKLVPALCCHKNNKQLPRGSCVRGIAQLSTLKNENRYLLYAGCNALQGFNRPRYH